MSINLIREARRQWLHFTLFTVVDHKRDREGIRTGCYVNKQGRGQLSREEAGSLLRLVVVVQESSSVSVQRYSLSPWTASLLQAQGGGQRDHTLPSMLSIYYIGYCLGKKLDKKKLPGRASEPLLSLGRPRYQTGMCVRGH